MGEGWPYGIAESSACSVFNEILCSIEESITKIRFPISQLLIHNSWTIAIQDVACLALILTLRLRFNESL